MSKFASATMGATPRAPTVVTAPAFGDGLPSTPPMRTRLADAESMPNRVVAAGVAGVERSYAAATTLPAGVRLVSAAARVPSVGFTRRLCSVSLTIRMRSATGLKSKPNEVPESVSGAPRAVAAPVVVLIV